MIVQDMPDIKEVQYHSAEVSFKMRIFNGPYADDWVQLIISIQDE